MVLLQIAEPGATPESSVERQVAVGIDLGTTNSLIAHFDGTELSVLADGAGQASLPSVVYYGAGQTVVGADAEQYAIAEPGNTIASAKRTVGDDHDRSVTTTPIYS
jgi:molecular chaperone HscA